MWMFVMIVLSKGLKRENKKYSENSITWLKRKIVTDSMAILWIVIIQVKRFKIIMWWSIGVTFISENNEKCSLEFDFIHISYNGFLLR